MSNTNDQWIEMLKEVAAIMKLHNQDGILVMGFCNGEFRNTVVCDQSNPEHEKFLYQLSDRFDTMLSE